MNLLIVSVVVMLAIEADIDEPESSELFQAYPGILADQNVIPPELWPDFEELEEELKGTPASVPA